MFELDHIAVVCRDLSKGVSWLSDLLGYPLVAGGVHPKYGTHNQLLGLADGLYLEVIAPDPAASVRGPRWFDLDNAPDVPRWGNWICRVDDVDAYAALTGVAVPMSRGDLTWQITVPDDGSLPMEGGFPTLIHWDDIERHPAAHLGQSGCRLTRWEVYHPHADQLRDICKMNDARVVFCHAEAVKFIAHFDTPNGPVII